MKNRGQLTAHEVFRVMKQHYLSKGTQLKTVELIQAVGEATPPEVVARGIRFFNRFMNNMLGQQYGSIEPLQGYEKLSQAEQKLFVKAHQKHLSNIAPKYRESYLLGYITNIYSNPQENGVDVRFCNGEKYTYNSEGVKKI